MFVAAFIGSPSMNLFEATVDGDHVVFGGHRLPLAADRLPAPGGAGGRRHPAVGLRGRRRLARRHPGRARGAGGVVEELGAEANVIFALDARPAADISAGGRTPQEESGEEAQLPLVAEAGTTVCTACVDARTQARVGERVRLSVDPSRLHFFDAISGQVLEPPAPLAAAAGWPLPLHAGERDPLDEHPLGEEEEHDHGQHEEQRRRHRQVPVDVVHRAERGQRDREGL